MERSRASTRQRRIVTVVFAGLVTLALLALARDARAQCQCDWIPSVSDAYAASDAVFRGRISRVEPYVDVSGPEARRGVQIWFSSDRTWKGTAGGPIVSVGDCALQTEVGAVYIVFARLDAMNQLTTSACMRTARVELAHDDLLALDRLPAPTQTSSPAPALHRYRPETRRAAEALGVLYSLLGASASIMGGAVFLDGFYTVDRAGSSVSQTTNGIALLVAGGVLFLPSVLVALVGVVKLNHAPSLTVRTGTSEHHVARVIRSRTAPSVSLHPGGIEFAF